MIAELVMRRSQATLVFGLVDEGVAGGGEGQLTHHQGDVGDAVLAAVVVVVVVVVMK